MSEYSFSFVVSGVDTSSDDFAERFFEAGCDDATLVLMRGLLIVSFDREAEDFVHAVASAYADVIRTGVKIERFEPDYLVNQIEISKRARLSRAAISLYVGGLRSKGFPAPCARVTTESPLWDWVSVSSWLHRNQHLGREAVIEARVARAVNIAVQSGGYPQEASEKRLIERMTERAGQTGIFN